MSAKTLCKKETEGGRAGERSGGGGEKMECRKHFVAAISLNVRGIVTKKPSPAFTVFVAPMYSGVGRCDGNSTPYAIPVLDAPSFH